MDKTLAHELAEQFASIINDDATVTEMSDCGYMVELSSDVTVHVDSDGNCEIKQ